MDKNKCPIFKSGTFSFCKKMQKSGSQHNAANPDFGKTSCDDKKKVGTFPQIFRIILFGAIFKSYKIPNKINNKIYCIYTIFYAETFD
jgi:hypothetical protein